MGLSKVKQGQWRSRKGENMPSLHTHGTVQGQPRSLDIQKREKYAIITYTWDCPRSNKVIGCPKKGKICHHYKHMGLSKVNQGQWRSRKGENMPSLHTHGTVQGQPRSMEVQKRVTYAIITYTWDRPRSTKVTGYPEKGEICHHHIHRMPKGHPRR